MGQEQTKSEGETQIETLREGSNFTLTDLEKLHSLFLASNSGHEIDEAQFMGLMQQVYQNGLPDSAEVVRSMFHTFDKDKNGKLNFQEFVAGLSVCCRGTVGERVNFLFKTFDMDNSGTVSKAEFRKILKSTSQFMKNSTHVTSQEIDKAENLEEFVDNIFKKFDLNGDGVLDFKEFKRVVEDNPILLNCLGREARELCYLAVVHTVIHPKTELNDGEMSIASARRVIELAGRIAQKGDRIVFLFVIAPINMDLKPPFQPKEVYRENHKTAANHYQQRLVGIVQSLKEKNFETTIWSKTGNLAEVLPQLTKDSHADVCLLLNDIQHTLDDKLVELINALHCSVLLVK